MESRWFVKLILVALVLVIAMPPLFATPVSAWDNVSAHPQINALALTLFDERKNSDPQLKHTSLDGEECQGIAWDPSDGISRIQSNVAQKRQKQLRQWIIDGGFSADEPEGPMALRHFYDPTNRAKPWLTDESFIQKLALRVLGTQAINPEISAVDWAMGRDEGLGAMHIIFPQKYGWPNGKEYFTKAIADKNPGNEFYGKAWRAVGETMHLVGDMTLPPHVRNDGHGPGDADVMESAVTAESVRSSYSTEWSPSINYNQPIASLMHDVAAWTNRNFFSMDTIPVQGKTMTANGKPNYPSPDMNSLKVTKSGYVESTVDGKYVRLARQSPWWAIFRYSYTIDNVVIADQQKILIPTAVRACEAVVERFLPRFEVQVSVRSDPKQEGKYTVSGKLIHKQNTEWPDRLVVRNGAYVVVNGKKQAVKLAGNDLMEFSTDISAKPGDEVKVMYDLGGYVIESDPATLKASGVVKQSISAEGLKTNSNLPEGAFGTQDNPFKVTISGMVRADAGLRFEGVEYYKVYGGNLQVMAFVYSTPSRGGMEAVNLTIDFVDPKKSSLNGKNEVVRTTTSGKDTITETITWKGWGEGRCNWGDIKGNDIAWSNGGSIVNKVIADVDARRNGEGLPLTGALFIWLNGSFDVDTRTVSADGQVTNSHNTYTGYETVVIRLVSRAPATSSTPPASTTNSTTK